MLSLLLHKHSQPKSFSSIPQFAVQLLISEVVLSFLEMHWIGLVKDVHHTPLTNENERI